jgi:hypothetical protein
MISPSAIMSYLQEPAGLMFKAAIVGVSVESLHRYIVTSLHRFPARRRPARFSEAKTRPRRLARLGKRRGKLNTIVKRCETRQP